ncbi:BrnT family toxin [Methylobacterium sp. Leaf466]|uniref:BrnT family toxin n=1 Tax=Methylobacterium sp. Leaf466 TaxID=1736386 RepID=UPI0009E6CAD6|nr:BrnT family toxin [Methylobacterium sp. Leaf466]
MTVDAAKSERNAIERGLPFDAAEAFVFETALIREDTRFAYPERRLQAVGQLGDRIVMLVFTPTADGFRVISLRPAHRKERTLWLASRPRTTTTSRP